MTQPVCTTCELTFTDLEEKLNQFSKFHKNRYIKYCKKCDQPIFFLLSHHQLSHHRRHKYFLISNPLYCFKSLCSCNIKDQICPFCKTAFSTKKELYLHHLSNLCQGDKESKIFARRTGKFI